MADFPCRGCGALIHKTVSRLFGTWTAGIVAAGFTPREPHGGGANVQRRRARAAA